MANQQDLTEVVHRLQVHGPRMQKQCFTAPLIAVLPQALTWSLHSSSLCSQRRFWIALCMQHASLLCSAAAAHQRQGVRQVTDKRWQEALRAQGEAAAQGSGQRGGGTGSAGNSSDWRSRGGVGCNCRWARTPFAMRVYMYTTAADRSALMSRILTISDHCQQHAYRNCRLVIEQRAHLYTIAWLRL
jgi:hypothetical protein